MKRMTTLTAVAAVSMLALAGCSGDTGTGNGSNNGSDNGGASGDNTLTVWAWDPAFNIFAMEEAAKIYQADNPDFTLEVIETPWDDLQAKLTTIAQSQSYDELPDIFLMQNNAFQKNVINYPELFADYSGTSVNFSEFPAGVTAYSVIDGVNFGVPFDSGTAINALRTDVLEEAGYTIDDFTNITWSEYLEKGKDILAKTGKPILSGQAGSPDIPMMMLQSAGASLFDEDGNPTIADNAVLKDVINQYVELVKAGVVVEVNSWDEFVSSFTNGNVAGTAQGVWILGSVQTAADQSGKWAVTNLPKLDGVAGATNYSANGGSSWALSSSGNKDLASDFLAKTFAGSTEFYDNILHSAGAVANWTPAGSSSVYAEPLEFFGGQPVFQDVVEFGASVPSNNTGVYYYEGRDALGAVLATVIGGGNLDDALAKAQSDVEFAMGG